MIGQCHNCGHHVEFYDEWDYSSPYSITQAVKNAAPNSTQITSPFGGTSFQWKIVYAQFTGQAYLRVVADSGEQIQTINASNGNFGPVDNGYNGIFTLINGNATAPNIEMEWSQAADYINLTTYGTSAASVGYFVFLFRRRKEIQYPYTPIKFGELES